MYLVVYAWLMITLSIIQHRDGKATCEWSAFSCGSLAWFCAFWQTLCLLVISRCPIEIGDHPYIMSAHFGPFLTHPPTHYDIIVTVLNISKVEVFWKGHTIWKVFLISDLTFESLFPLSFSAEIKIGSKKRTTHLKRVP